MMDKRYDTILFDLDGTLTDPQEGITKSVQYALCKMGIDVEDRAKLLPFIGPPLMYSFQHFYGLTKEEAREAIGYYREYFERDGMYDNRAFDGMVDILAMLKAKGKTLLVATSKPTIFADPIVRHYGMGEYFKEIVGASTDGTRTEKGQVIAEALRYTDSPREAILMIGDREHDVIGAREHGIDVLNVGFGYGTAEEREVHRPDYYCETMEDLAEFLSRV
jgi:phosphoglycolate phosphatase